MTTCTHMVIRWRQSDRGDILDSKDLTCEDKEDGIDGEVLSESSELGSEVLQG